MYIHSLTLNICKILFPAASCHSRVCEKHKMFSLISSSSSLYFDCFLWTTEQEEENQYNPAVDCIVIIADQCPQLTISQSHALLYNIIMSSETPAEPTPTSPEPASSEKHLVLPNELSAPYEVPHFPIEKIETKKLQ